MTFQSFWQSYEQRAPQQVVQLAYGYTLKGYDVDAAFQMAQDAFTGQNGLSVCRTFVTVSTANGDAIYEVAALTEKGLQYLITQVQKRGDLDVTDSFGQYHLELLMWKNEECFYVALAN